MSLILSSCDAFFAVQKTPCKTSFRDTDTKAGTDKAAFGWAQIQTHAADRQEMDEEGTGGIELKSGLTLG